MDLEEVRELGEYDTVAFRTGSATLAGLVGGTIWGAVVATWHDVPAVERNVALPALKKTARIMSNYGLTFAAISGIFAFTDAVAESIRGKKDFVNGIFGGLAAGPVLGLRARSVRVGLGASVALAAISTIVDASGHTYRTPIGKEYLPYPTKSDEAPEG